MGQNYQQTSIEQELEEMPNLTVCSKLKEG